MRRWLADVFVKAATVLQLVPAFMGQAVWHLGIAFLTLIHEGYKKNAVAYACIRLLAQSVPEPPLKIYRLNAQGREEEDPEHPCRLLIKRPNPYQTEFEFWELTSTYLSVCGRAPWWKEKNRLGEPIALWPLRPDRIAPILGIEAGAKLLAGWEYRLGGRSYTLPPGDVLYFNFPDPSDDTGGIFGGLGPMQVLAQEIDTDQAATSHVYALIKNFAMPGVLLKVKNKLTKDTAKDLKDAFVRRYGDMHRGEPAVIDNDADVTALSNTLKDLEFPDVRAISETRIAAAFGTPPVLVGLKAGLDKATMNNVAESRELFTETTLAVLWRRLSDQITVDLLPDFTGSEGLVARFDVSAVKALQKQLAERAARFLEGLKAGAVSVNEYRHKALGLDPAKGGDVFLRLSTMIAVPVDEEAAATDARMIARRPQPMLPAGAQQPPPQGGRALPAGKAVALKADHEFGSTQVNLQEDLASAIRNYQMTFTADEVAAGGLEAQSHITVLFGLDPGVTAAEVADAVAGVGPITARFGKIDAFPAGDDGVPLFVSVTSPGLHRLHDMLTNALPNTETHTTYTPHVTVAYVTPEAADRYVGQDGPLNGRTATFSMLVHSAADRSQTSIVLRISGKAASLEALGEPLVLSAQELASAAPSPEDLAAAADLWERAAPDALAGLLNGNGHA